MTKHFCIFACAGALAATLHGQGSITSQSEFWLKYRDTPVIAAGSTFDGRSQRPEEWPAMLVTIPELRNPLERRDRRQIQRAIAAADRGDHHAAIDQLERLLHNHPKTRAYVTSIRGAEYLELGEWDEAEACRVALAETRQRCLPLVCAIGKQLHAPPLG